LTSIGENAFNDNSLTGFNLPTPIIPGYVLTHWIDGNSNTYAGGEAVIDLGTSYTAVLATTGYEVTFTVTDGTNTIAGAVVNLGIYGNAVSDASGIAIFSSVDPITDLTYIVTATGYANATSTITVVDSDVSENVVLMLTGIPDLSENHFNLYPNPAEDFVYLQLKEDALVSIINISGKMVVLQEVSKGHAAISTTYIKPGIYIFKVETENIVITKKIMIK